MESVYAVFEAKPSINATQVRYAQDKVESVRRLYRTSMLFLGYGWRSTALKNVGRCWRPVCIADPC
ncbi:MULTISPECIES: hypothetical protein [Caballeronia]|uniref:hypothetical protein n=1 Tax=Caballeronia TaxID=1827195 RepID=UPI002E13E329